MRFFNLNTYKEYSIIFWIVVITILSFSTYSIYDRSRVDDANQIKSTINKITKTSFFMRQKVFKGNDQITDAEIHLVTVDIKGKPVKIPERLKEELKKLI